MFLFFLIGAIVIAACHPSADRTEPNSYFTTPAFTQIPSQVSALQSTSTPRWMEYQIALLHGIHPVYPFTEKDIDEGLCEWSILGQRQQQVYVWAMCQIQPPAGISGKSVPVVIRLSDAGNIVEVRIPRDGINYAEDIETFFPPNIQEIILNFETLKKYFDPHEADEHLALRWENPSILPMIVEKETPLP